MALIDKKYNYERIKLRHRDGGVRYSANTIDAVAKALFGLSTDDLIRTLNANNLGHAAKHAATKSHGHFRMIAGQTLRAAINKGTPVMIAGHVISSLLQDVPWPEGWTREAVVRRGTPTPPARMVRR